MSDIGFDVVRYLNELFERAVASGASDIHIQTTSSAGDIAFRLDGHLSLIEKLPASDAHHVVGRIKFLAELKTYQEKFPQDGRIGVKESGVDREMRVSTYPTVNGEKVVLRLFSRELVHGLEHINIDAEALEVLRKAIHQNHGMILLTGPSGSGKTTTIYACLQELSQSTGKHIISIEDPVEQILPGIMQTETNEPRHLGFAEAAKHLLRQDPEVLVIGEIRDEETARVAVRAALTGHLLIATLHAGSTQGVLNRLVELSQDRMSVLDSLILIWNQRLIRRYCQPCSGAGCENCLQTGYKGRLPVVEYARITDNYRHEWRQSQNPLVTPDRSLAQSASFLLDAKLTSGREIHRIFG